ncbi:phosphopantetheine-binding protein [Streptomyces sp. NPDC047981]|uniref:phosphopantetheine-binding protein n=1 Tax=Streptomyces sp. NPDC047981 TaxID=3154610 RepID=UPI003433D420
MTTPTGARERMTAVVQEVVGRILPDVPREEIIGGRHLRDLGADSVDRVEIILGILERLGLDESMSSFSELPDIDALVDFLVLTEER